MEYFCSCHTIEELRKEYRRLCMIHHPDRGGDAATMAAINNEYDETFRRMQHDAPTAERTTAQQQEEHPESFRAVVSRLVILEGLKIEVCGSWIWITGNTYANREAIKAAGCRYSKSKTAWYWRPEDAAEIGRHKAVSMDKIRQRYGSQIVTGAPANRIQA